MDIFQIDAHGQLYISPEVSDWSVVGRHNIDTIIDLEGGLDHGVPTVPNQCLYIYFPINDGELPNLKKLHALARMAASLIRDEHRVLSHCGMGFNRSALVAGLILRELGHSGPAAVEQLRERRPGALYNPIFAEYLQSLSESLV